VIQISRRTFPDREHFTSRPHLFPSPRAEVRAREGGSACMGRPEAYRRYAEECLKLASGLHEPSARAALRHMAQVWLRLAQDAESRSRPENQSA
jgi:hypothetical protein